MFEEFWNVSEILSYAHSSIISNQIKTINYMKEYIISIQYLYIFLS
jgi:hypothetical protein